MFKKFVLTAQKTQISLILFKGISHIYSANNKKCKKVNCNEQNASFLILKQGAHIGIARQSFWSGGI